MDVGKLEGKQVFIGVGSSLAGRKFHGLSVVRSRKRAKSPKLAAQLRALQGCLPCVCPAASDQRAVVV